MIPISTRNLPLAERLTSTTDHLFTMETVEHLDGRLVILRMHAYSRPTFAWDGATFLAECMSWLIFT